MLRRSVKIQLILFVVITLVGVAYVSAEYVGLTKNLFGSSSCTIHADFTDSGGIFSNAEVTYRGVTVGRVGSLHLIKDGVRVDLDIDDCGGSKIPVSSAAQVADRSVIGEQYVDLLPPNGNGPYFKGGESDIPISRTTIPTATQTLLVNLDQLVKSLCDPMIKAQTGDCQATSLTTTIDELGAAFNNNGADLGSLLDATNALVDAARTNLPATIQLIDQSASVLQTQLDEGGALQSFVANLDLFSQQLKASDGDIRHLLDAAPGDLNVVSNFVKDNRTDLGVVFANLVDIGDLLVRHKDGIEQILELYPAMAAGGPTVLHDNKGYLGDVLQAKQDPPDCGNPTDYSNPRQGYQGTKTRLPQDISPMAPNVSARCTAPISSGVNVRGSAHVPGGDPVSVPDNVPAYPRVDTSNLMVDPRLENAYLFGANGWQVLLTDALH